jgi:hypothetical protein
MAQQGKQMRDGACKGLPYQSVKLLSLANGNRYEVDSNLFPQVVMPFYPFEVLPCYNSGRF